MTTKPPPQTRCATRRHKPTTLSGHMGRVRPRGDLSQLQRVQAAASPPRARSPRQARTIASQHASPFGGVVVPCRASCLPRPSCAPATHARARPLDGIIDRPSWRDEACWACSDAPPAAAHHGWWIGASCGVPGSCWTVPSATPTKSTPLSEPVVEGGTSAASPPALLHAVPGVTPGCVRGMRVGTIRSCA